MYRTTRTSSIYVTIVATTLVLVLLTSTMLTGSVYAARTHHHSHRSIEGMPTSIGGYQAYGNDNNPVSYQANGATIGYQANGAPIGYQASQGYDPSIGYQANGAPVSDQANGVPIGYQANGAPVSDQANGVPIGYQANGAPISYQANGVPIGYQASQGYDPSIGYPGYGNNVNDDNSGPISMHTSSHHHNSDVSSINRI